MSKSLLLSLIFSLAFFTVPSFAEQKSQLGPYEVHYIAFNSTFVTPEIAKLYDIQRSRYNALINISVLDSRNKNKPAVEVKLSGTARNLIGNQTNLDFKEVREGEAVYYLAQLRFSNEETFRFEITVDDGKSQQLLKFQQKLYVD